MQMQIFWDEVQKSVALYSLPILIVGYLVKSFINHLLDKDISAFKKSLENDATSFKQSLENTANLELEKYKSQLETERVRLQIAYGGIFEKQANAILDIYRGLLVVEDNTFQVIDSSSENIKKNRQLFVKSILAVMEIHALNRILLPEEIDNALNKFIKDMHSNVARYARIESQLQNQKSEDELQHLFIKQEEAEKVIEVELPKLKELLINNMRETLGIKQK